MTSQMRNSTNTSVIPGAVQMAVSYSDAELSSYYYCFLNIYIYTYIYINTPKWAMMFDHV